MLVKTSVITIIFLLISIATITPVIQSKTVEDNIKIIEKEDLLSKKIETAISKMVLIANTKNSIYQNKNMEKKADILKIVDDIKVKIIKNNNLDIKKEKTIHVLNELKSIYINREQKELTLSIFGPIINLIIGVVTWPIAGTILIVLSPLVGLWTFLICCSIYDPITALFIGILVMIGEIFAGIF